MSDVIQLVNELRRPKLMLAAVRHGLGDYQRERTLRRFLGGAPLPTSRRAVALLLSTEEQIEEARRAGDASYSPARHIDALIALISEARLAVANAETPPATRRLGRTALRPVPRRSQTKLSSTDAFLRAT